MNDSQFISTNALPNNVDTKYMAFCNSKYLRLTHILLPIILRIWVKCDLFTFFHSNAKQCLRKWACLCFPSSVSQTYIFRFCKIYERGFSVIFKIVFGGHYIIPGAKPFDAYHDLHLPHSPPLYPTLKNVPLTRFNCEGRDNGYYADVEAGCQVDLIGKSHQHNIT